MKPTTKSTFRRALPWCALALAATSASAQTTLLTDSFNEITANEVAETFNDNLAVTQGGTLATTAYTVGSGNSNAAQHSNGGTQMTLATFPAPDGRGFGRVSLDNDFATQANAANQALRITFNLGTVFGYENVGETINNDRWVSFSVGNTQNQFITNDYVGVLFRANGATQTLSGDTSLNDTAPWAANDLVTITLSATGGSGSAFNGNGTEATISIGDNTIGTFALDQQSVAFLTFSAYNDTSSGTGVFGGGNLDNLSVSLVSTADPFLAWINATWPSLSDKTPTGDPDNDGIDNLIEYVLKDGDPSVSTTGILPTVDASGTDFVFNFCRRTAATGTTQTFQYGNDLSGWTDVPVTDGGIVSITSPEAGIEQVAITVAKGAETKLFGRLQVVK
jgi:hypothetical protein